MTYPPKIKQIQLGESSLSIKKQTNKQLAYLKLLCLSCFHTRQLVYPDNFPSFRVRGCLHEKTHTSASLIPGWLFDFISRHLKVHFVLIKYTCDSKLQTLRMRYLFQSTCRPISHRNVWSFCVYMIPMRDFVPEWNSPSRYKNRGELMPGWLVPAQHFVVVSWNKYKAMRGNQSELAPGWKSPRCNVNTPWQQPMTLNCYQN